VVGGGSIGKRHLQNLGKFEGISRAVVEPDRDRRMALLRDDHVAGFDNVGDGLGWDPDVLVIATPSHLHLGQASVAARRGCHLFVEKPLFHSGQDAEVLIYEVEARALVSMVACNFRFHPGPARIKEVLDNGVLGRVFFARVYGGSYLPSWHPDEDYRKGYSANASMGGGCVLDGIHLIDLAHWFLGDIETVTGTVGRVGDLGIDVEDIASIVNVHASGQRSEVHIDYLQRFRVLGCHLAGSEGSVVWDWEVPEVRLATLAQGGWKSEMLGKGWEINQMYLDEMHHFLDCVRQGRQTCNPIREAAKVTNAALSVKRSSEERRFVEV